MEQNALNTLYSSVFSEGGSRLGVNTATYNDSTCCVIRPHVISAGMLGAVLYEIQKSGLK